MVSVKEPICGIILAGGAGSRLWPVTHATSKQLLNVYDKPMIYYPLTTLMLAGIRDILIITATDQLELFKTTLGDGERFGIYITYATQDKPDGIANAFKIGKDFIAGRSVALILGDNIFYSGGIGTQLREMIANAHKFYVASVFLKWVPDPERFGVAKYDPLTDKIECIIEKPDNPPSNYAVVGLYVYPENVVDYVMKLKPSPRGEYEITDLNNLYARDGELQCQTVERGALWFDTGTTDSMADAAQFVRIVQKNSAQMLGCPEEVAIRFGWYDNVAIEKLKMYASQLKNEYGIYLRNMLLENGYLKPEGVVREYH
jgi:glucose-1-phosphate thymidylyltransferase